jgi:hypothetical protein
MAKLNGIELLDMGNAAECFVTDCAVESVGGSCACATFYVPRGAGHDRMVLEAVIHLILPIEALKKIARQLSGTPQEIGATDDSTTAPTTLN